MANINLTTPNYVRIVQSIEQDTLPTDEDILPGAPVKKNVTTGKFTNANGSTSTEARPYGIATGKGAKSGMPLTAVAKGVLDGFDFTSQAYDKDIFVSDTDGRLADAAGTVSKVVGQVTGIPTLLGQPYDKVLRVNL